MNFTFSDAMRSAQAAVNSAETEAERQLAYAVGQLASALQVAVKELNQKLDQLQRPEP